MQDNNFDDFIYSASHDIQQPLRNVKSFAQLLKMHLKDEATLDESSQEYLNIIMSSALNLQKLVDNIRSYLTITKDEEFQTFSLNSFFGMLHLNLQKEHPNLNIQLEYADLPEMEANPDMIKMMFKELVENAIKFKSDENVLIRIQSSETSSSWQFQVADNGIGVKQEFEHEIFKPFSKYHAQSGIGGSGLGLATVKKIIEFYDGQISCTSNPRGGSVFKFEIKKPIQPTGQISNGQRNSIAS